jgi:hypothetical protein
MTPHTQVAYNWGLAGEWARFVLPVDDLPRDGLESLRVRFDLLGPGAVQAIIAARTGPDGLESPMQLALLTAERKQQEAAGAPAARRHACAVAVARITAGTAIAARIEMMMITTSSSTSVKAPRALAADGPPKFLRTMTLSRSTGSLTTGR